MLPYIVEWCRTSTSCFCYHCSVIITHHTCNPPPHSCTCFQVYLVAQGEQKKVIDHDAAMCICSNRGMHHPTCITILYSRYCNTCRCCVDCLVHVRDRQEIYTTTSHALYLLNWSDLALGCVGELIDM